MLYCHLQFLYLRLSLAHRSWCSRWRRITIFRCHALRTPRNSTCAAATAAVLQLNGTL